MPMNPTVLKSWISAMLSGAYERGVGWLAQRVNNVVKHCPLGVLTDLAEKAGVIQPGIWRKSGSGHEYKSWPTGDIGFADGMLPVEVRAWSGATVLNLIVPTDQEFAFWNLRAKFHVPRRGIPLATLADDGIGWGPLTVAMAREL